MNFVKLLGCKYVVLKESYFDAGRSDFETQRDIILVIFLVVDDGAGIGTSLTSSSRKPGRVSRRQ